jgi:hypothetical protein
MFTDTLPRVDVLSADRPHSDAPVRLGRQPKSGGAGPRRWLRPRVEPLQAVPLWEVYKLISTRGRRGSSTTASGTLRCSCFEHFVIWHRFMTKQDAVAWAAEVRAEFVEKGRGPDRRA